MKILSTFETQPADEFTSDLFRSLEDEFNNDLYIPMERKQNEININMI